MEDIVRRDDGSWLIDGSVTIERLKSAIEIEDDLPGEDENAYNTLGGLVMYILGRIPAVTDTFESTSFRFEVMGMDKNRVDKVLLSRLPTQGKDDGGASGTSSLNK
jgi:putative hemolysin